MEVGKSDLKSETVPLFLTHILYHKTKIEIITTFSRSTFNDAIERA